MLTPNTTHKLRFTFLPLRLKINFLTPSQPQRMFFCQPILSMLSKDRILPYIPCDSFMTPRQLTKTLQTKLLTGSVTRKA